MKFLNALPLICLALAPLAADGETIELRVEPSGEGVSRGV